MKRRFARSRTDDMRAFLARQNRLYPAHLVKIPEDDWPEDYDQKQAKPIEAWRSRDFLLQVIEDNGHLRLSVNRTVFDREGTNWDEGITWDDLMRLKAEAGFADRWAIEIFPPVVEVVNVANMRHLWLLDGPPPQAWVKSQQGGMQR